MLEGGALTFLSPGNIVAGHEHFGRDLKAQQVSMDPIEIDDHYASVRSNQDVSAHRVTAATAKTNKPGGVASITSDLNKTRVSHKLDVTMYRGSADGVWRDHTRRIGSGYKDAAAY